LLQLSSQTLAVGHHPGERSPAFLFSTVLYSPFTRIVYRAIYGAAYDYDALVSTITSAISEARTPRNVSDALISHLSVGLHIEHVALWLRDLETGQASIHSSHRLESFPSDLDNQLFEGIEGTSYSMDDTLIMFHEPRELGGVRWQMAARLMSGDQVIGVMLGSSKEGHLPYSLQTFASLRLCYMGESCASHLLPITDTRFRSRGYGPNHSVQLNCANKPPPIHDRVITSLALVKRMMEAGRGKR
jgi:hypothetical protein